MQGSDENEPATITGDLGERGGEGKGITGGGGRGVVLPLAPREVGRQEEKRVGLRSDEGLRLRDEARARQGTPQVAASGGTGGEEEEEEEEMPPTRAPRSVSPSPFEPYSLGEVFVRTAADSDLAPAGVGAGPWRRRWLVLRQTYVFELLQPPPRPSSPPLTLPLPLQARRSQQPPSCLSATVTPAPSTCSASLSSRRALAVAEEWTRGEEGEGREGKGPFHKGEIEGLADVDCDGGRGVTGSSSTSSVSSRRRKGRKEMLEGQVEGAEEEVETENVQREEENQDDRFVAPVGFLCLSKASVEEGGVMWGPRTLLLRWVD